jgi:hypothetical protein
MWVAGKKINATFVVRNRDVVYLLLKRPDHFSIHNHRDNISIYTVMFTLIPTLHKKRQYVSTVYYMVDKIQFSITKAQTHTAPLLQPS